MSNPSLFEGDFEAKATKPEVGAKNGKPVVRVEMEISTKGDRLGRRLTYEGKLDADNIKYTKSHMMALGWQGKDIRTFVDDVVKANRTVPVQVRIATWDPRDGRPVRQWSSIDRIGSFAPPLSDLDRDKIADVNSWFAEVPDEQTASNGAKREEDPIPF